MMTSVTVEFLKNLNLTDMCKEFMTSGRTATNGFPSSDRVRLISSILKGPALHLWVEHLDGNPTYSELYGVLKAFVAQLYTTAHQKRIKV